MPSVHHNAFRRNCCRTPTHSLKMYDNVFFLILPHFHVHPGYMTRLKPWKYRRCAATPSAQYAHCPLTHEMITLNFLMIQVSHNKRHWISRKKYPCWHLCGPTVHQVNQSMRRLQSANRLLKPAALSRMNFLFGLPTLSIGIGYNSNERVETTGPSGLIKPASPAHG